MSSFSILRTNVGLTTNVKIMVTSDYDLFLESIDSSPELSNTKYKKFRFNKDNYYDELLPYFFRDLPVDISYSIRYDQDNSTMSNDFSKQFDDIYYMGCRNIVDNKNYTEEYECFAPLYINKGKLPKNFIIFRIDGPGLINLSKDNFRSEIVNKIKCVKSFNLTTETVLGEWLNKNITNNSQFPTYPLYIDYRSSEFSTWNGIDMTGGGYVSRSYFLDSVFEYENLYFDLEKAIFDGYKNYSVAFPHILNFSFLFDDTPATPNSLRKWSLNRYMGFYFDDLEFTQGVSVYVPPKLKSDVYIETGNLLKSSSSSNPFDETWKKVEIEYVEIGGTFYPIQKFEQSIGTSVNRVKTSSNTFEDQVSENFETYYKIISDIDFSGLTHSSLNQNIVNITSENKLIKESDNSNYVIEGFSDADLWLIEIDSKFHVLVQKNGAIYIQTDYAFDISVDKIDYYVNYPDPNYRTSISLIVGKNNSPKVFKIYRGVFTDIKDFDTQIVDTEYSKFEYQKKLDLTQTDETKMYSVDYNSTSIPKDIEDYKINDQVVNIPASSEYTANGETFRIMDNDLTPLWRKNAIRTKWGYQNSLSANDYPYLLNNSFASEDYNRTVNPFDPNPKRIERNLDYFYTINSSTSSYSHHSLHVENFDETGFKFEWDKYLGFATYSVSTGSATYSQDYFTQFFGQNAKFDSGDVVKKTHKWSTFNSGDGVVPNITLFRGIKLKVYDIDSIITENSNIKNINVRNNNKYEGYKFSILLSKNDKNLVIDPSDSKTLLGLTAASNSLTWKIIDDFKYDKPYDLGDIVNYQHILYIATSSNTITDPTKSPANLSGWQYFTSSVFWSPTQSYTTSSQPVYYNGEYYKPIGTSNYTTDQNFWIPNKSYTLNNYVIYNSRVYKSMTASNNTEPSSKNYWYSSGTYKSYWTESTIDSNIWSKIELWSNIETYNQFDYVIHNQVLFQSLVSGLVSIEPGFDDTKWKQVYSMVSDTNFVYSPTNNNIILMNNRFYLCTSNLQSSTLDDGIVVYVNNKFKNILVNIYINDNTLSNLSNADRDLLYNDLYKKLSANNFINCLNVLSNRYGFVDHLKYVVIDNDSTKVYSFNNISSLPVMLVAETPDQFFSRISSLHKVAKTLKVNQFKAKRKLDKANIQTIDMMNWFNDSLSLGTEITKVKGDPNIIPYYSGLSNAIYNNLFRHSGPYMPIFHDIELFKQSFNSKGQVVNYQFDTSLTNFGLVKEQIISKVNRNSSILQLRSKPDLKSIWPMIDEFGYTFVDFFIFKSTWDFEFHIECLEIKQVPPPIANKTLKVNLIDKNSLL